MTVTKMNKWEHKYYRVTLGNDERLPFLLKS